MIQPRPEAILLDRDGTINVKAPDGDYITRPEQLELLPRASLAIALLNTARVPVVVLTNQRGIALGRMTEDDLDTVHNRLAELLWRHGAWVDAIFHCPHDVGVCRCRKPGTLLFERAREHLGLKSLERTVMIGDSRTDVMAGRRAGACTVFLGATDAHGAVHVAASLFEAVEAILYGSHKRHVSGLPSADEGPEH